MANEPMLYHHQKMAMVIGPSTALVDLRQVRDFASPSALFYPTSKALA